VTVDNLLCGLVGAGLAVLGRPEGVLAGTKARESSSPALGVCL